MNDDKDILGYMLEVSSEATFIVHKKGEISRVSAKAREILGLSEGSSFSELLEDPRNDALSDFVFDTVLQKKTQLSQILPCYPKGAKKPLLVEMRTIPVSNESGDRSGILVMMEDCTEREKLAKARREASLLTMIVFAFMCLYLFFWQSTIYFGLPLKAGNIADIGVYSSFALALIALWKTSLRDEIKHDWHMGLKTMLAALMFTLGSCALVMLLRWLLGKNGIMSAMDPDWGNVFFSSRAWKYYLSAIMQEFLARGIMQNSMRFIFAGKHRSAMAIISSSLFFGVLHAPYGVLMMVGAAAFMGVFGIFFEKTRSIPATAISHMTLGRLFIALFGF